MKLVSRWKKTTPRYGSKQGMPIPKPLPLFFDTLIFDTLIVLTRQFIPWAIVVVAFLSLWSFSYRFVSESIIKTPLPFIVAQANLVVIGILVTMIMIYLGCRKMEQKQELAMQTYHEATEADHREAMRVLILSHEQVRSVVYHRRAKRLGDEFYYSQFLESHKSKSME